jgi:predicted sulfurtransferase
VLIAASLPKPYLFSKTAIIREGGKMKKARSWPMVLAVGLMLAFTWSCATGQNVPRLDKETLKNWLSDPQVVILDVRQPQDWQASDKKIKGAVRQEPKEVKTWAAGLPKDKKIVLYCA